jgi:hypothetical protein
MMPLSFPNPSRSFDATNNRADFWGYDNVIEVSFHVEIDAIKKLCPKMEDAETEFIKAFDTVRKRIHEVAEKVYGRGGKNTYDYILAAKDFLIHWKIDMSLSLRVEKDVLGAVSVPGDRLWGGQTQRCLGYFKIGIAADAVCRDQGPGDRQEGSGTGQ